MVADLPSLNLPPVPNGGYQISISLFRIIYHNVPWCAMAAAITVWDSWGGRLNMD
ncbi:hypothetical protein [Nitrosomonas sp. Is37]|uniref:hypothetical protein n=1 Tax=Nitrosomonas sp. Is37 TaxID=3080535 RepID=UPI00294AC7E2|nr:hypothetical protein [Nitrosomonas sp. Is37]MDV6345376.1 hypothetical protein [Nitrosomonas sp. Is37]